MLLGAENAMISQYNFKYTGLMKSAMQSIPLGNGDLGANVWADENAVCLLLSKTDAFSRLHRLLKTGYLKLHFPKGVLNDSLSFHLVLNEGILKIENENIRIQIYADAFHPVYKLAVAGESADKLQLEIVNYRDKPERLSHNDRSNYQLNSDEDTQIAFDSTEDSDTVFTVGESAIGQMHENTTSLYNFSLQHQHLEDYPDKADFLTGRTFGFLAHCKDMSADKNTLTAKKGVQHLNITIHSLTCENAEEWMGKITQIPESDIIRHKTYWKSQWKKSYVYVSGSKKAEKITEGYILQRYMNICAGKGRFPIKFNGSIFTCQTSPHNDENYDYRMWGGYYWFQNTRLIYWSMLFSGDYDLMLPFFKLYTDNLDFAKFRTQKYFGHSGAFYPETMSLFGTYADTNYGWERDGLADGTTLNTYIRYYYCSALELSFMMLLYCRNTKNSEFLKEECLPFVKEILLFFYEHYKQNDGSICFKPASSLETWQNCINDAPNIAGVGAVCDFVLHTKVTSQEITALCKKIKAGLPPLPLGRKILRKAVMPFAENIEKKKMNCENPELYTVFPYAIYKIGKPNLKIGIHTFKIRAERASCGWQQHSIQAAFLGLRKNAYKEIVKNCENTNKNCIFPAFYGPNYDWLPDQDNGANLIMTITKSLVQENNEKIYILPAWNKKLNVSFRLPVGDNFINVTYQKGKKPQYSFDNPENREVVIM